MMALISYSYDKTGVMQLDFKECYIKSIRQYRYIFNLTIAKPEIAVAVTWVCCKVNSV